MPLRPFRSIRVAGGAFAHVEALGPQLTQQDRCCLRILQGKRDGCADDGDLRSEPGECLCQFKRGMASAGDQQAGRAPRQGEDCLDRQAANLVEAVDRRHFRLCAGGHDKMPRSDFERAGLDCPPVPEACVSGNNVYAQGTKPLVGHVRGGCSRCDAYMAHHMAEIALRFARRDTEMRRAPYRMRMSRGRTKRADGLRLDGRYARPVRRRCPRVRLLHRLLQPSWRSHGRLRPRR
jgi:hypothetical protein